jgi:hypothetical protein
VDRSHHAIQKIPPAEGLSQKPRCAQLNRRRFGVFIRVRRYHEDGDLRTARMELGEQVQPGLPRHSEIADDQIKRYSPDGIEGGINIRGSLDAITLTLKRSLDRFSANPVVICDEDRFHFAPSKHPAVALGIPSFPQ